MESTGERLINWLFETISVEHLILVVLIGIFFVLLNIDYNIANQTNAIRDIYRDFINRD